MSRGWMLHLLFILTLTPLQHLETPSVEKVSNLLKSSHLEDPSSDPGDFTARVFQEH